MEEKKVYIRKDERSCYRVPESYFDNLTAQIVIKAQAEPVTDNSWGGAARRLLGFVAGFAIMVGLAATAFYFTPSEALEQHKQTAQNATVEEFTTLYNVSEDDILEYYYPTEERKSADNAQLALAIDEYLLTYPIANVSQEDIANVNEDDIDF